MTLAPFYESFIRKLNSFGKYQKARVFVLQLVIITIPICSLTSIFSLQSVDHKCYIEERKTVSWLQSLPEDEWQRLAYPPEKSIFKSGTDVDPSCSMYDPSLYSNETYFVPGGVVSPDRLRSRPVVPCESFIIQHKNSDEKSATAEFEIFCKKEAFRQTATALLFVGKMIGLAVSGQVADVFGRRPLIIFFQVFLILVTAVTAFVPNWQLFLLGRLFVGFSYSATYLLVFTIVCEMLLSKHIAMLGFMMEASFGTGMALLAGFAYVFKDWRQLQVAAAVAGVPSVLVCIWCPESLRWLVSGGNFEKARPLAAKIAKTNKVDFDLGLEKDLQSLCQNAAASKSKTGNVSSSRSSQNVTSPHDTSDKEKRRVDSENSSPEFVAKDGLAVQPGDGGYGAHALEENNDRSSLVLIIQIFRTPKLRSRVIILAFCWFIVNAVYYGISLGGTMIPGSLYLNTAVGGLLEIPAMVLAYFVATKFGRKWLVVGSFMLSGLSCASMSVTTMMDYPLGAQILAQIGRFGISLCYGVIYVYTLELIPTCVRTTGMSFCSFTGRIGSILTPYAALLSEMFWQPLGFLIYGLLGITAGLLTITLPETLNRPLQDSYEDAIKFGTEHQKMPHPGIVHIVSPSATVEKLPGDWKELEASVGSDEGCVKKSSLVCEREGDQSACEYVTAC